MRGKLGYYEVKVHGPNSFLPDDHLGVFGTRKAAFIAAEEKLDELVKGSKIVVWFYNKEDLPKGFTKVSVIMECYNR